jgi:integrase
MVMAGKTGRRGHNEGAIYQRADGRWVGAVHLGWEGGKRRRKVVYGKTRAEVNRKLTRIRADQERGLPIQTADTTVAAFLDEWIEVAIKKQRSASTYTTYRAMIDTHITPAIGKHRLTKLTQQHVQTMLNALTVSATTARLVRAILHTALKQAMSWDLVGRNVAALTTPPRGGKFEGYALSPEEVQAVMVAVRGDDLEALYAIATAVGLRQSELLGLRWRDVDREAGTLTIRHQLGRRSNPPAFVELKSRYSRRVVTLPPPALAILRAHYRRQLERRLLAWDTWQDYDLVFAKGAGGPYTTDQVRSHWHVLRAKAGLPEHVRFHDLRHSALTILAARGTDPRTLMGIAGHSDIATTMQIYAHLVPQNVRDSIDRMSDLYPTEMGAS